ncbi:putative glyoxalase family protein [Arthrobacter sp. Rue61a]|nr:putative glyoxalase family protein [Arthrobacter sp. Rue61a]
MCQPNQEETMRFVQVAQHADDLQRAAAFYAALLDAEPSALFDPPGLLFFDVGGVRLLLEKGAPSSLLYLEVADLDGTVAALRRRGVRIIADPHIIYAHEDGTLGPAGSEEWMAFIEDSEANTVGLVSRIRTAGD